MAERVLFLYRHSLNLCLKTHLFTTACSGLSACFPTAPWKLWHCGAIQVLSSSLSHCLWLLHCSVPP